MLKFPVALLLVFCSLLPGTVVAQEDTTAQWQENLDVLATELHARHVDPFTHISEDEWNSAVEALRTDIPALTDEQIRVRMMALVAMLGDSHTTLYWAFDAPIYPLSLVVFEDGIYPIATYPDAGDALGLRLVSINGQPIEDVIAQMQTLIAYENESWLNAQLPNVLVRADILMGLGIIEMAESVEWGFETKDGESVVVNVTPVAPDDIDPTLFEFLRSSPNPVTESTNGYYWVQLLDDGTLYFKYNTATEAPDLPMSQFTEILLESLEGPEVERLVIDLRNNTGGNSTLLDPLITALTDHPINAPDTLFVIIGARTYSSAVLNAMRLAEETEATLVGQPTGGAPNHFGEVQRFDLPHFGLSVTHSTNYFELMPGEEGTTLAPDILVPLTIDDYVAGIDTFYSAVLELEANND